MRHRPTGRLTILIWGLAYSLSEVTLTQHKNMRMQTIIRSSLLLWFARNSLRERFCLVLTRDNVVLNGNVQAVHERHVDEATIT